MDNIFIQRLRLAKALDNFHESFFSELMDCQYRYTKQAFSNNEQFVFIDYYIPSEIFWAMDMIPVMSEHSVNFLASLGLVDDLLVQANYHLNDSGTCSFHKPIIPAFKNHLFPKPQLFATTTLCGESAKCFSLMSDLLETNYFCIDVPYSIDECSLQYIRQQYIELARRLEIVSGRKLDVDKFKQCVKKSNIMRDYLIKGNELRKNKVLLKGNKMLRFGGSFCYHGTDEAIKIAKSYYDLMFERSNNGVEINHTHRILWTHLRPFYVNKFFDSIENDLGLAIAFEETNDVFWRRLDEEDPFKAMAEKTVDWICAGNIDRRIQRIKALIKNYQIDGVMNFAHINCRVLNPKQYLLRKSLQQVGVPVLELSGDCIDRHNFSENQLLTRVEAFAELLQKRGV